MPSDDPLPHRGDDDSPAATATTSKVSDDPDADDVAELTGQKVLSSSSCTPPKHKRDSSSCRSPSAAPKLAIISVMGCLVLVSVSYLAASWSTLWTHDGDNHHKQQLDPRLSDPGDAVDTEEVQHIRHEECYLSWEELASVMDTGQFFVENLTSVPCYLRATRGNEERNWYYGCELGPRSAGLLCNVTHLNLTHLSMHGDRAQSCGDAMIMASAVMDNPGLFEVEDWCSYRSWYGS